MSQNWPEDFEKRPEALARWQRPAGIKANISENVRNDPGTPTSSEDPKSREVCANPAQSDHPSPRPLSAEPRPSRSKGATTSRSKALQRFHPHSSMLAHFAEAAVDPYVPGSIPYAVVCATTRCDPCTYPPENTRCVMAPPAADAAQVPNPCCQGWLFVGVYNSRLAPCVSHMLNTFWRANSEREVVTRRTCCILQWGFGFTCRRKSGK